VKTGRGLTFILLSALAAACQQPAGAAEAVNAPAAERHANEPGRSQTAIFSGGCYWGVEGVFSHVKGVTSAVSGFQGGARSTAQYERVSEGDTGHAESVRVTYDPTRVRYDQLLQIFFSVIADPTQLNRQGPDVGTQYRSALVPMTEEQRRVASAYLAQMRESRVWHAPIVTKIEPYKGFYPAAADHQDFMARNPNHPYIQRWDAPKVAALKRLFPGFYNPGFTLH
jgi:peptide-methionine (S)-S-oxide reductase